MVYLSFFFFFFPVYLSLFKSDRVSWLSFYPVVLVSKPAPECPYGTSLCSSLSSILVLLYCPSHVRMNGAFKHLGLALTSRENAPK